MNDFLIPTILVLLIVIPLLATILASREVDKILVLREEKDISAAYPVDPKAKEP